MTSRNIFTMRVVAPALTAGLLLTACAASDPVIATADMKPVQSQHLHQTVKPGAALGFSHTVDGDLSVGSYSDVLIRIDEGYEAGRLTVLATGSASLDVLASSNRLSRDLSAEAATPWRIAVRPGHDGLHYLTLQAEVTDGASGQTSARVQSIRLDLGGKMRDELAGKPDIQQLGEEGAVAVLRADETIRTPSAADD